MDCKDCEWYNKEPKNPPFGMFCSEPGEESDLFYSPGCACPSFIEKSEGCSCPPNQAAKFCDKCGKPLRWITENGYYRIPEATPGHYFIAVKNGAIWTTLYSDGSSSERSNSIMHEQWINKFFDQILKLDVPGV